jgi:hypothetical protein
MRSKSVLALTLLAAVSAVLAISVHWAPTSSASSNPGSEKQPVVVELFTSEGCSSCPPADSFLKQLSEEQPLDGIQVIALEEHVDYWNRLGWNDPFSSPDFSRRQEDYASIIPHSGVYTPQMILDGHAQLIAGRTKEVFDQIRSAAAQPKARLLLSPASAPNEHTRSFTLTLDPSSSTPSASRLDLWVAVTEKGLHTDVKGGENSGSTLYHAPVVRELRKFHSVSLPLKDPVTFTVDLHNNWNLSNLSVVAFLANPHSRQILAAGSAPATPTPPLN